MLALHDETPFRDTVIEISHKMEFQAMSFKSDRARSHGWWRNLVEYGAWVGPGNNRVGPPTPEALPGIAALFGTTEQRVSEMIAADWYGVYPDAEAVVSPRVLRLGQVLDSLSDNDTRMVEELARRLAKT